MIETRCCATNIAKSLRGPTTRIVAELVGGDLAWGRREGTLYSPSCRLPWLSDGLDLVSKPAIARISALSPVFCSPAQRVGVVVAAPGPERLFFHWDQAGVQAGPRC